MDELRETVREMRRFASAAEGAIGEISIDEAFHGIRRVVSDRVAQLTGESPAPLPDAAPVAWLVAAKELAEKWDDETEGRSDVASFAIRSCADQLDDLIAASSSPAAKEKP